MLIVLEAFLLEIFLGDLFFGGECRYSSVPTLRWISGFIPSPKPSSCVCLRKDYTGLSVALFMLKFMVLFSSLN